LSRLLARVQHADVIEACKISGFLQQQVKLLRLVLINEFSFRFAYASRQEISQGFSIKVGN
jgi:hypothetical protein